MTYVFHNRIGESSVSSSSEEETEPDDSATVRNMYKERFRNIVADENQLPDVGAAPLVLLEDDAMGDLLLVHGEADDVDPAAASNAKDLP
jgi:hypothetical protein